MKKIANIINFARGAEPRSDDDSYLLPTLATELRYCRSCGFKSTVLLQYDALIKPEYRALVQRYGADVETGLWLEVTGPQAERCGIPWEGRFVWDWEGGCNYLTHYSPAQRTALLDEAFGRFKEYFGSYPAVVGCWSLDSFSLQYMHARYGLKAACICRDQYGTDYTTLWGGVYNGAYYPCRNNVLCPADSEEEQINVPVFRMLGPDPVYQYDMGLGEPEKPQTVCTLEPVYPEGGGSEAWVRSYMAENYNDKGLSHAYAQFGQENSFGWDEIGKGLPTQLRLLREKMLRGEIDVLTLGEAGDWYRAHYEKTAPVAMCTDSDWKANGYRSVWYASRYYRANLLYKDGAVWVRDLQLFDEKYVSGQTVSRNGAAQTGTFNLPVTDGFRFSKDGIRAGIWTETANGVWRADAPFRSEALGGMGIRACAGAFTAELTETRITFALPAGTELVFRCADVPALPYRGTDGKTLRLGFCGFGETEYSYAVALSQGRFEQRDGALRIVPENGRAVLELCAR